MSETERANYEAVINEAAAKISSFKEFKTAYNRELAFDFDPFRFFKVGENKISQILAAFLNPEGRHGQGDLFLRDFAERLGNKLSQFHFSETFTEEQAKEQRMLRAGAIERFNTGTADIGTAKLKTEQSIENEADSKRKGMRRIDLYINMGRYGLAIENKVWAKDQPAQLKDYRKFLQKRHSDRFLLVYLTPYGNKPDGMSISDPEWKAGLADGSLCSMSYKHHIIPMLEAWEAQCKAERVRFFIREFKNHLNVKFLGNNNLNMANTLKDIVMKDPETVKALADAYSKTQTDLHIGIDQVSEKFRQRNANENLGVKCIGPFKFKTSYVFKLEILVNPRMTKDTDQTAHTENQRIFIHLSEKDLKLRLKIFCHDSNDRTDHVDLQFENYLKENWSKANKHEENLNDEEKFPVNTIVELMKQKTEEVKKAVEEFEDRYVCI